MPSTRALVMNVIDLPERDLAHGESVGLAVTPTVAIAYAIVAVFLFALSRMPAEAAAPAPMTNKAVAATPAE